MREWKFNYLMVPETDEAGTDLNIGTTYVGHLDGATEGVLWIQSDTVDRAQTKAISLMNKMAPSGVDWLMTLRYRGKWRRYDNYEESARS